jgi:hypothetical protein
LDFFVRQTSLLDPAHVLGVDVRMLSGMMLLRTDAVVVKVNNQLEELVVSALIFQNHFDTSTSCRRLTWRLTAMFLV